MERSWGPKQEAQSIDRVVEGIGYYPSYPRRLHTQHASQIIPKIPHPPYAPPPGSPAAGTEVQGMAGRGHGGVVGCSCCCSCCGFSNLQAPWMTRSLRRQQQKQLATCLLLLRPNQSICERVRSSGCLAAQRAVSTCSIGFQCQGVMSEWVGPCFLVLQCFGSVEAAFSLPAKDSEFLAAHHGGAHKQRIKSRQQTHKTNKSRSIDPRE
jgi:hypothetical protein